jgi:hypothetical protein
MSFTPISLEEYVETHLQVNPQVDPSDLRRRLRRALADFQAGRKCRCGNPIWVVGSAEVGNSCFTCITGEAPTSGDYELEEALNAAPQAPAPKGRVRHHHRSRGR